MAHVSRVSARHHCSWARAAHDHAACAVGGAGRGAWCAGRAVARLCELWLTVGEVIVEVGTVKTAELCCVLHRMRLRSDDVAVDVQAVRA
jgi:hypothetical protein